MDMLADFTAVTRELLSVFADAEPASVVRGSGAPVTVSMVVDDAVQDIGQYARVVAGKRVVICLRQDWILQRGDLVTVRDGSARAVDAILADDGITVTAVLLGDTRRV